jgi:hypothetical protein
MVTVRERPPGYTGSMETGSAPRIECFGMDDLTWDQRIFQLIDPGVDGTLIAENLRRTPSERPRRMEDMAKFLEDARCDQRPAAP